jgi:hypothetical protein
MMMYMMAFIRNVTVWPSAGRLRHGGRARTENDDERPQAVEDEEADERHVRPALAHGAHELAHGHAEEQTLGQDRPQPVCTPVSVRSSVKAERRTQRSPTHAEGGLPRTSPGRGGRSSSGWRPRAPRASCSAPTETEQPRNGGSTSSPSRVHILCTGVRLCRDQGRVTHLPRSMRMTSTAEIVTCMKQASRMYHNLQFGEATVTPPRRMAL